MRSIALLAFCVAPPPGQADTAKLKQKVSLYCPPSQAFIILNLFIVYLFFVLFCFASFLFVFLALN